MERTINIGLESSWKWYHGAHLVWLLLIFVSTFKENCSLKLAMTYNNLGKYTFVNKDEIIAVSPKFRDRVSYLLWFLNGCFYVGAFLSSVQSLSHVRLFATP